MAASLIPLSGRQSSLEPMSGHHGEAYRIRHLRQASPAKGPQKLKLLEQPNNASSELPFRIQPKVQLLDENNLPVTKQWDVIATGGTRPTLSGTKKIPSDGGIATFKDLKVDSPASRYRIIFRVDNGSTNLTVESEPFEVRLSPYTLEPTNVTVRHGDFTKKQSFLHTQLIVRDAFTGHLAKLEAGDVWYYHVELLYTSSKLHLVLGGETGGKFNSTPFVLEHLSLTGWVYSQKLHIRIAAASSLHTPLEANSNAFDAIRPPTYEVKRRSIVHVLSIKVNASGEDALNVDHNEAEWAFLNEFGVTNGSQVWADCRLLAVEEPKFEWQIIGKIKDVLIEAKNLYEKSKIYATFTFKDNTWALIPKAMTFEKKPFYGNDPTPPEPAFTIAGVLYSHVLLGVVIAVMILPVCYLCLTWKRHERIMQERYQERLQQTAQPPKDNKPKKSKRSKTEAPKENVEAERSNNGDINAPPFYIDTLPPPPASDMLPGHVFNGQDEWKMNSASAPLYPSFNPTGDGLPPSRFRWSAPEKTEMMELTMTQLKQQHRDFMEQTAGAGGNLSFSRYSSSGGDPFCLDDVESTHPAFQEVSFNPPSSVRLIPPATAPRPLSPEAMEQLARNLKEGAPQKTLSAPTIPTHSTYSQNNKTAVSKIVVAPIIDTCPLPGGVATEPTHTRPVRQTSLPEPQ